MIQLTDYIELYEQIQLFKLKCSATWLVKFILKCTVIHDRVKQKTATLFCESTYQRDEPA